MKTIILMGSVADKPHAQKIKKELKNWGVKVEEIVGSAHKNPEKVLKLLAETNASKDAIVYITIAGRSNALSGMVAANSKHPVIACPPFKDKQDYQVNIHSTLQMPSLTPVLTVLDPGNAALATVRLLGLKNANLSKKILTSIDKRKK